MHALVIRVGSGGERRGDGVFGGVGHLLNADHGDDVGHTARNRAHPRLEGHTARGAGRLDRRRLDTAPAAEVGDERAELLLVIEARREHVADEQGVGPLDAGFPGGGV